MLSDETIQKMLSLELLYSLLPLQDHLCGEETPVRVIPGALPPELGRQYAINAQQRGYIHLLDIRIDEPVSDFTLYHLPRQMQRLLYDISHLWQL